LALKTDTIKAPFVDALEEGGSAGGALVREEFIGGDIVLLVNVADDDTSMLFLLDVIAVISCDALSLSEHRLD